jgi:hypothetical protein
VALDFRRVCVYTIEAAKSDMNTPCLAAGKVASLVSASPDGQREPGEAPLRREGA